MEKTIIVTEFTVSIPKPIKPIKNFIAMDKIIKELF